MSIRRSGQDRADLLMVGLVPPPLHGQSLMTKALFESDLSPFSIRTIGISFNDHIHTTGAFGFIKVLRLIRVVFECIYQRFRYGIKALYYTPGSPNAIPFLKDILFLATVRPFFATTVLHYHSGGLPEYLNARAWRRWLARAAYGRNAVPISLSPLVPVPAIEFGATTSKSLPNGIKDAPHVVPATWSPDCLRLVFIGNLYKEKGVLQALEASISAAIESPTRKFHLSIGGGDVCEDTTARLQTKIGECPSNLTIEKLGVISSEAKWDLLQDSHVMLFPTSYASENFPLVILEAMACGVPSIASPWRGIPSIIRNGENGFLVSPDAIEEMSKAIQRFAADKIHWHRMSQNVREDFLLKYTWKAYIEKLKEILLVVLPGPIKPSTYPEHV